MERGDGAGFDTRLSASLRSSRQSRRRYDVEHILAGMHRMMAGARD